MEKIPLELQINGQQVRIEALPGQTLNELLRNDLGLTGPKNACLEGECGSCTVIMNGLAVMSCLVLAAQANGSKILTIEGLGAEDKLDPLQEAFIEQGAVQCGYCTPGMIMAAKALLLSNMHPSEEEIRQALEGNLCRCTGYVKPVAAVLATLKSNLEGIGAND